MAEYLFVLGRDAELALLELESFFSSESVRKHKGNFVIVETDDEFDVEDGDELGPDDFRFMVDGDDDEEDPDDDYTCDDGGFDDF